MPLASLCSMWTRSVRPNPLTVRMQMPWDAVCGQVPRFANFGLLPGDTGPMPIGPMKTRSVNHVTICDFMFVKS